MVQIVVIGAGIGGLPVAYELRRMLPKNHKIILISNTPKFTFIPSLPWVGLGLKSLNHIQLDVEKLVVNRGIKWVLGAVTQIHPELKQVVVGETVIPYDYAVIATGAELALDVVPGLQEAAGYVQSVCNPAHALKAAIAWQKFLKNPGNLVVGALPGAGCFATSLRVCITSGLAIATKRIEKASPHYFCDPRTLCRTFGNWWYVEF